MTQPVDGWSQDGSRFLPGQDPVGGRPFGMGNGPVTLPGINDQPGQRFGGPAPVQPESINLDAPPPVAPAPGEPASGWRVKDDKGNVVATFSSDPVTSGEYQKKAIQKIGDSLVSQATTPEEHAAAARATAYGLSLVGSLPTADIQKAIASRYDQDMGNSTKLMLQGMRSKNRQGVGGPAPKTDDPYAPTKANKFRVALDKDLADRVEGVVKRVQADDGYKAVTAQENSINQIQELLDSGRAMGERVAVQRELLDLTGKASRESEQTAITGAAGKWNEFANKISSWTSDDPVLTRAYINQFKGMLGAQRQFAERAKDRMGRSAAASVAAESRGYPEEQQQAAADAAYGAMTGRFATEYKPPHERGAAPKQSTPAGKVDDDLVQ